MLRSLWDCFRETLSGVTVIAGGSVCPLGQTSAWCEVWIDQWSGQAVRPGQRSHGRVVCTAHLFIRPERNGEATQLATQCRRVLSQVTTLETEQYAAGDNLAIHGVPIRWNEGDVRDMTRLDRQQTGSALRHFVCTWEGRLGE